MTEEQWEWLKNQPEDSVSKTLRKIVDEHREQ
jgi:hypothetical protein